jgi:intraflagellar transport protein 122
MHFRIRPEKIMIKDCSAEGNLLVITSQHLIFSRGRAVELYSFDGVRQKVWNLESVVNYLKVDGGLEGQEGVLLGLQSGIVSKLFVDNPFPIELTKRPHPVKQLDINIYRTTLAIVRYINSIL